MSHSKETIPIPSSKPEKRTRTKLELMKRRTAILALGLTGLFTLLGTVGANYDKDPNSKDKADRTELVSTEFGMQQLPGGIELPGAEIDINLGQSEQIVETDTTQREVIDTPEIRDISIDVQLMEWARLFNIDPSAIEPSGRDALISVINQIEQLKAEGSEIVSIEFQGYASGEDDWADYHSGDNPGFGKHSDKNEKLAHVRSVAVKDLLFNQLQEAGVDNIAELRGLTHILPGVEKEDATLADNIDQFAKSHGFSTVELVKQFNRDPGSLSAEARKTLEGLLDNRFVRINIVVKKAIEDRDIATNQVTTVEKVEQKDGFRLIIIPMLIPIFKRKRDIFLSPDEPIPYEPPTTETPPLESPKTIVGPPKFEWREGTMTTRQRQEEEARKRGYRFDLRGRVKSVSRALSQKQPRPYSNAQGGGRRVNSNGHGMKGQRITRSHGGNR